MCRKQLRRERFHALGNRNEKKVLMDTLHYKLGICRVRRRRVCTLTKRPDMFDAANLIMTVVPGMRAPCGCNGTVGRAVEESF